MKRSGGFFFCFVLFFYPAFSWGPQGHRLVALIARSQLDHSVIETINYYLHGMSWEDAANWMDKVQGEPKYDYMKTWHYVNVEKDKAYVQNKDNNVVNKLEYCIRMLQYKNYQTEETMNETLKLLFHLIGDIHQPLHCGYEEDQGGNDVKLYLILRETNLHKLWDTDIIENKRMDIWHCAKALVGMKLTDKQRADIEKTDVISWMNESRALLPTVYSTNGKRIDQKYIDSNTPVVETQLIKAGLRLAAILNKYFK
jgi:hypothetical protein